MDKDKRDEIISGLMEFKEKLKSDVFYAYDKANRHLGGERFFSWKKRLGVFLDSHLPGESSRLKELTKCSVFVPNKTLSHAQRFWSNYGERTNSFLGSLIVDLNRDEYVSNSTIVASDGVNKEFSKSIFIVHGHDGELKNEVARFIGKLDYEAVILHEQVNRGQTIIEKIETYSDVGFAIVLYTPDDKGGAKADVDAGNLNDRARQNVVFEHGYLIGKLGRDKVVPLVSDNSIELPGDISGTVYVSSQNWKFDLSEEIKAAFLRN